MEFRILEIEWKDLNLEMKGTRNYNLYFTQGRWKSTKDYLKNKVILRFEFYKYKEKITTQ
jgi:hypothetical protein